MTISEQARADALADAETLRLSLPYTRSSFTLWGLDAATVAAGGIEPHVACVLAKFAARAAFRAVPGLRGE